jgi:hypothetical protein
LRDGKVSVLSGRHAILTSTCSDKVNEKLHYMHQNPVVRRLVEKPEQLAWSSYCHYATGVRGTVEIESMWTAAGRGYEMPIGFEVRAAD